MRQSGRAFQTSKANEHIVNQIDVNKVSDVAGAEILNVNLSKPLSEICIRKNNGSIYTTPCSYFSPTKPFKNRTRKFHTKLW